MMSRTGNKGFTLIEVMAASCVLALGGVLIYESFFISLDAFSYYTDYLRVSSWVDEKIWEAQDSLTRLGSLSGIERKGDFQDNNKNLAWDLDAALVTDTPDVYRIDLSLSWQKGKKNIIVSRSAYATHKTN